MRSGSFTVMLSYEWSSQPLVIEVRKALQAHGVTCWMDVDGGMKRDIFDSMAEGVTCCTTIVPFMTQAYQNSENCKLELCVYNFPGIFVAFALLQFTLF